MEDEEYATLGIFTTIFGGPIARVLDQSLIVGNMEQTVSMLTESTHLSYKTVQTALEKLVKLGFVTETRKIGNAQAYRFEVENDLHNLINCAQQLQLERLKANRAQELPPREEKTI